MASATETNYRTLARLCRVVRLARDARTLLQEAAAVIHEATNCGRVGLLPAPGGPLAGLGLIVELAVPPRCFELSAASTALPAAQEVIECRQPRVVCYRDLRDDSAGEDTIASRHFPVVLYLPLLAQDEVVGVLGIAGQREEDVKHWHGPLLEDMAGLVALALAGLVARADVAELKRYQREAVYLRGEIRTERDLRLLTGESAAMKAVRQAIQQVARTDSTVLILGETGTGKELVARAIHQLGPRRDHLLVAVNCAALAPGVIASELFGHEPGAFTGATRRRLGRFELAQRGTLFLDEVGELPLETQVMLLRVLQERVIERVGGGEPVAVDVRVIAATHRELEAALSQGHFRADLYFRLNVFPIRVPPLRERRADIPDLVRHFLHHFGRRMGRPVTQVSPAALRLLTEYDWPGNVRELENLVERALIVSAGATLEIDPSWLRSAAAGRPAAPRAALAELERQAIVEALARCHGRVYGPSGAAAVLGLKPTTLYGKMRKHHIERRPGAS